MKITLSPIIVAIALFFSSAANADFSFRIYVTPDHSYQNWGPNIPDYQYYNYRPDWGPYAPIVVRPTVIYQDYYRPHHRIRGGGHHHRKHYNHSHRGFKTFPPSHSYYRYTD